MTTRASQSPQSSSIPQSLKFSNYILPSKSLTDPFYHSFLFPSNKTTSQDNQLPQSGNQNITSIISIIFPAFNKPYNIIKILKGIIFLRINSVSLLNQVLFQSRNIFVFDNEFIFESKFSQEISKGIVNIGTVNIKKYSLRRRSV